MNGEKQGAPYQKRMDHWKAAVPAKRFVDPAEIANPITFLASIQTAYSSGTSLLGV